MKITRDVISDLMPVYEAGEASSDTKALVEAFLKQDPEFARQLEAGESALSALKEPGPPPSIDVERESLERSRTCLRRRSYLLGCALAFTLLPLSFSFTESNGHFALRSLWGSPEAPVLFGCFAALCWVLFVRSGRDPSILGH